MFTKEAILNDLRNGVVFVSFKKADGTDRLMKCTVNSKILDDMGVSLTRTSKFSNDDLIVVYDLEKGDWRSFNVSSVRSIVPSPNTSNPYAELQEAFRAGKQLQVKLNDNTWIDMWTNGVSGAEPYWNLRPDQYRISPEPKIYDCQSINLTETEINILCRLLGNHICGEDCLAHTTLDNIWLKLKAINTSNKSGKLPCEVRYTTKHDGRLFLIGDVNG
jgi:hypothetical protein